MVELRGAMAHRDFTRHAERIKRLALEALGIDWDAAGEMQLHVDEGAGQVFDRGESLIEIPGASDLLYKCGRNGLAGFVVHSVATEHGGGGKPVFKQLGWELHVVACDSGARQQ